MKLIKIEKELTVYADPKRSHIIYCNQFGGDEIRFDFGRNFLQISCNKSKDGFITEDA